MLEGVDCKLICFCFLRVNRNIKKEWMTLPRPEIAWLNMLAHNTLAFCPSCGRQFLCISGGPANQNWLIGNPSFEPYSAFNHLTTTCWCLVFKCVWERFSIFQFVIFLDYPYPDLVVPCELNILLVALFLCSTGFQGQGIEEPKLLNCCRLCTLSSTDVLVTLLDLDVSHRCVPSSQEVLRSTFIFPCKCPTEDDWGWYEDLSGAHYLHRELVLPLSHLAPKVDIRMYIKKLVFMARQYIARYRQQFWWVNF